MGKNKLEDKENMSGTDTRIENNPVKIDETYFQIFKLHFYLNLTFDKKNTILLNIFYYLFPAQFETSLVYLPC